MAGTITHQWNGTILTITSDSGTTACDLKGEKGDDGARGAMGLPGDTNLTDAVDKAEAAAKDAIAAKEATELIFGNAKTASIVCEDTASVVSTDAAAAMPAVGLVSNIDGSGWNKITLTHTNRNLVSHLDAVFTQGHKNVVPTAEYIDVHTPTTFDYQRYDNIKLKAGQPYTYVVNFEVYGRDEADTRVTSVAYRLSAKSSSNTARDIKANGSYTHVVNYTPDADITTTLLCYPNFGNNGTTKVPSKVKTRVMLLEGTYTAETAPAFVPCEKETFTATLPQTITSGEYDWNTGILTDASGTEYQLEPQQINLWKGYNTIWSDTGETALTYNADIKLYIDNRVETLTNAIISLGGNV